MTDAACQPHIRPCMTLATTLAEQSAVLLDFSHQRHNRRAMKSQLLRREHLVIVNVFQAYIAKTTFYMTEKRLFDNFLAALQLIRQLAPHQ
jgi:hypothetical protein